MSLFRYPGGKSKLVKHFTPFVPAGAHTLYEPFVGGGSVFTYMLRNNLVQRASINDIDPFVSAFWKVLFGASDRDYENLIDLMDCRPTAKQFDTMRETKPVSIVDRAFYAIFFNRTTFSGIMSSGKIGGNAQTGKWTVDCRYNAPRLIAEANDLRRYRDRVVVRNVDFSEVLPCAGQGDFVYLDPPYIKKGGDLYTKSHQLMSLEDHTRLRDVLRELSANKIPFLLSYDVCDEVEELYAGFTFHNLAATHTISGKKTQNKKTKEYLITA